MTRPDHTRPDDAGPPPASGGSGWGRRRALAAAVVTGTALALAGCASTPTAATGARPSAGTATAQAAPDTAASALDALLVRRETALAEGDERAFAATVSEPGSAAAARQLAGFRAARALGVDHLAHDPVPAVDDPADGVVVTLRYRIRAVDRGEHTASVRYRVARSASGWRVTAEEPTGTDAAPPWLAMPGLTVRRSAHGVVAGTAPAAVLTAAAGTVDAVLPGLAAVWDGTPSHVLVLVPATAEETGLLLGRTGPGTGDVAATTAGPLGPDGRATGDEVVLDATARGELTPTGREVVLAHELVHVAVRATVPGTRPPWLDEGYADHVGYARADLPQRTLAAALIAAVRAGGLPAALPGPADLDPAVGDIEVGYLEAWQAVEVVAARAGEVAVRDLVRACSVSGDEAAAEDACDRAMPRVIGMTRAQLTRAWQQRLSALAR